MFGLGDRIEACRTATRLPAREIVHVADAQNRDLHGLGSEGCASHHEHESKCREKVFPHLRLQFRMIAPHTGNTSPADVTILWLLGAAGKSTAWTTTPTPQIVSALSA